jgi:hypothetical protein
MGFHSLGCLPPGKIAADYREREWAGLRFCEWTSTNTSSPPPFGALPPLQQEYRRWTWWVLAMRTGTATLSERPPLSTDLQPLRILACNNNYIQQHAIMTTPRPAMTWYIQRVDSGELSSVCGLGE